MKKSIPVRVLTALGGLVLLSACAGLAAEGFFGVPVLAWISGVLASKTAWAVLVKIVGVLALAVLAAAVVICALPAKPPRETGSIMQKGENGPIGITVGAIRKMVMACAEKHPEIIRTDVDVRQVRDGIVILMDVEQVGGVSIPLSVARLQKQVRQYINGRTGLDVAEVRVMVDNQSDAHVASEFEVQDMVMPCAPVHVAEYAPPGNAPAEPLAEQLRQIAEMTAQPLAAEAAEAPEAAPAPDQPAAAADPADLDALVPEVLQAVPEMADDAEKPLHQRVFGAEEAPMTVPMPPEMAAEPAPEAPAEEAAESVPEQEEPEALPQQPCVPDAGEDWMDPTMQEAALAMLSGEDATAGEEPAAQEATAAPGAEEAPDAIVEEASVETEASEAEEDEEQPAERM